MITIRGLSAGFGSIRVLHDVSFEIAAGRLVTVIGANGAGKTTLLRTISGLVRPTAGDVLFEGRATHAVAPHALARMGLVHVPQGRQIVPTISVRDNLLIGARRAGSRSTGAIEQDLDREFTRFPVLRERQHIPGGNLSGGEQQMLALSRALMMRPKVLMLDEPSLGLAPQIVAGIMRVLRELASSGLAVLLVEQLAMLALQTADDAYVLQRGRIVMSGSAAEIRANKSMVDSYLA